MARVAGVSLPENKKIKVALTYIYGVGSTTSMKILEMNNVNPETRTQDLTSQEIQRISNTLKGMIIEGELRQTVFRNIKRLKDSKAYRGIRHKLGLPVRGQKTRTNAVTRKGKNLAVGGLKRKIEKT